MSAFPAKYFSATEQELQPLLQAARLPVGGRKRDLVMRLLGFLPHRAAAYIAPVLLCSSAVGFW